MSRNADNLPDILNRLFDLPIGWESTRAECEISLDVLKEFSRLSRELAATTTDGKYHSAISFLWSTRRYVGIDRYNASDFIGTEISSETSRKIRGLLKHSVRDASNALGPIARSGPSLSALILHPDRTKIFELVLKEERLILRRWGLNQNSVEIIVQRLRELEFQTFLNVTASRTVNSDTIGRACLALQTLSKIPVKAYVDSRVGRQSRSSKRPPLLRAKDKCIGIATLFGDAAPLVWGSDLNVSSWISAVAGATAMAILPRNSEPT